VTDSQGRSSGPGAALWWLFAALALFAAACGPAPSDALPPVPTARGSGVVRLIQEAPRTLDPREVDSVYESLPVNQIFDTLITFDPSLNVAPSLAETWTISKDGLVYTFQLRGGVTYHDGRPLAASDVVFSVRRILRPADGVPGLAHSYLMVIDGAAAFSRGDSEELPGVHAVGERTVRFRLLRPSPLFLEVLSMDNLAVVPEAVVKSLGEEAFGRRPVASGPFRLAQWTESMMLLEANPHYFGGAPHLDALEIHFLDSADGDFGAARFFNGELDLFEPATENLDRLSGDEGVRLQRYQELSLAFLGLNNTQPPLDQPWLRQAIAHSIDRRRLVEDSPSVRREATGIVPPGMGTYSPDPKTLPYDPERARRLLAEAGHPNGRGLPPIRLFTAVSGRTVRLVIARLRHDLEAVGLQLEVVDTDWGELSERLENRTAQAFLLSWIADLTHPDSFVRSMFESGGSGNFFNYVDETTDELLERGASELNPVERSRLYRELEHQILERAPLVPLYHTVGIVAMRDHLRGVEPGPLGLAKVEFEKVWLYTPEGSSSVASVD
jgi:ABC-type transport system substrate-binding protein